MYDTNTMAVLGVWSRHLGNSSEEAEAVLAFGVPFKGAFLKGPRVYRGLPVLETAHRQEPAAQKMLPDSQAEEAPPWKRRCFLSSFSTLGPRVLTIYLIAALSNQLEYA